VAYAARLAERLSTTDSPCYIPAFNAEEAAAALDTPSEYLSAACTKSSCRTEAVKDGEICHNQWTTISSRPQ
jgi:hypothetical protein